MSLRAPAMLEEGNEGMTMAEMRMATPRSGEIEAGRSTTSTSQYSRNAPTVCIPIIMRRRVAKSHPKSDD